MRAVGIGQCSLDYILDVDVFPKEDTKLEAKGFTIEGGGPVATALVALKRLGIETLFIGRVSDDWAGRVIKKGLKKEGVSTKGLYVKKGDFSQTAFIMVNRKQGSRTIVWKRPTVGELKPLEVKGSFMNGSSFLLMDGLMAEASLKAARTARVRGIPVMLDCGRMRQGMRGLIKVSDYIVGSEGFSKELAPTAKKAIKEILSLNPGSKAITITLGQRGSVTYSNGETFHVPAFRIKAVDTTGAGDVFHGGYVYGLLMNWDIEKTVRFASAFAAIKCLKIGGRSGIPTLKQTLRFMRDYGETPCL